MDGWTDGCVTGGWLGGQMDEWTGGRMVDDRYTDRWWLYRDRHTDRRSAIGT